MLPISTSLLITAKPFRNSLFNFMDKLVREENGPPFASHLPLLIPTDNFNWEFFNRAQLLSLTKSCEVAIAIALELSLSTNLGNA